MSTLRDTPKAATVAALRRLQIGAVVAGLLLCIACPSPSPRPAPSQVLIVEPASEALLQEPPPAVRVTLREPVDPDKLVAEWLTLSTAAGPLTGTTSVEGQDGRELVWRPAGELPRNEVLVARLSAAVELRNGKQLGEARAWGFLIALQDATAVEFQSPVSLSAGPSPYGFVPPVRTLGGETAAVWWTSDAPVRQEGAFRDADGTWSPSSVLLGAQVPSGNATMIAGQADLWLLDADRQSCVVHQKLGPAAELSLPLARPFGLRLDDGSVVVWSASGHRLGLDVASLTWSPAARDFVPTAAAADFGADVESFFGGLPLDGENVQQIVRRQSLPGGPLRLVAIAMDRAGRPGASVELLEVDANCQVIPVANGPDFAALLLIDQVQSGSRLRVLPFRRSQGWGQAVTMFSGLVDVTDHAIAVSTDGRVLVAVLSEFALRVAEIAADGSAIAAQALPAHGTEVVARIDAEGGAVVLVRAGGSWLLVGRAHGRTWSLPYDLRQTGLFASQQSIQTAAAGELASGHFLLLLGVDTLTPAGTNCLLQELVVQLR